MSHPVTNQPAPISILGKVGAKRLLTNDLTPPFPLKIFFVFREDPLEGKSGASSRGNSSSNNVYIKVAAVKKLLVWS